MPTTNQFTLLRYLGLTLASALLLRFGLLPLLSPALHPAMGTALAVVIIVAGAAYPLTRAAETIEAATDHLSSKTGLAAGLLQSVGTAFPDMVLGVTAAIISLSLLESDPTKAISFALIAASTTFGSNIYNIGHAIWCIHRQNRSDTLGRPLLMFPGLGQLGTVRPLAGHRRLPRQGELDTAIRVLTTLSILTAAVALCMVLFGHVGNNLYTLIRPAGGLLLAAAVYTLYHFRQGESSPEASEAGRLTPLAHLSSFWLWLSLAVAGTSIAFSAEAMVRALDYGASLIMLPPTVAGTLAGVIGCLGEILVVHNYTIHQNGRIADAVVGVAMDNIVTISGAAVVAILGGIYLGTSALIILFLVILALNTLLVSEISTMKTTLSKIS